MTGAACNLFSRFWIAERATPQRPCHRPPRCCIGILTRRHAQFKQSLVVLRQGLLWDVFQVKSCRHACRVVHLFPLFIRHFRFSHTSLEIFAPYLNQFHMHARTTGNQVNFNTSCFSGTLTPSSLTWSCSPLCFPLISDAPSSPPPSSAFPLSGSFPTPKAPPFASCHVIDATWVVETILIKTKDLKMKYLLETCSKTWHSWMAWLWVTSVRMCPTG